MEKQSIAERIRNRLEELGKNPSAVALEAGLNRSAVQDILRGKAASPRLDTLQKLTGPLECSLEYLTGGSDDPGASPDAERTYALLDTTITSPSESLETGVFRENRFTPAASKENAVVYRDPRRPHWSANLYLIGDETLAGIDIRKGDYATVLVPSLDEEIVLRSGMLVVVRREITQPVAHEISARIVEIHGDEVHLASRPASGSSSRLIVNMSDRHPGDQMAILSNSYFLKDGGSISVEGVVGRITRALPI